MIDLESAIENLYKVFNQYTKQGMQYCQCGCKNKKDVDRITTTPLLELSMDDLAPYHGSALYTWGDLTNYKYFLPQICELI